METPCVSVCVIDAANGLCEGCGRTIAEISRWYAMTSAERLLIMAELETRQGKHRATG
jgi:uncharacterized protein